jgi:hypothetical protein
MARRCWATTGALQCSPASKAALTEGSCFPRKKARYACGRYNGPLHRDHTEQQSHRQIDSLANPGGCGSRVHTQEYPLNDEKRDTPFVRD